MVEKTYLMTNMEQCWRGGRRDSMVDLLAISKIDNTWTGNIELPDLESEFARQTGEGVKLSESHGTSNRCI